MKNIKILLVFLFPACALGQYSVTSTHFSPLPLTGDIALRGFASINADPYRVSELEAGVVYNVIDGLGVGIGVHGGVAGSPYLFGAVGGDLMLRYVKDVSETFFLGAQAQAGVVYTGINDPSIEPKDGLAIPVTIGGVFGANLSKGARAFVSPAIELGQTHQAGDGTWKSGVGFRCAFGAALALTPGTSLVLEARPGVASRTFLLDAGLGVIFDW